MTIPTIFCPNSHLILSAPACPVCGWQRPENGTIGEPAWEHPLELHAELGGPGRHVFARMAAAHGMAVLPLLGGSLVGIALADGRLAWRTPLEGGQRTRAVLAHGNRLIAALSDERQFTEAEHGMLATITPASGKLATLWEAEAPMLSLPVVKDDLLFLRTSRPELVALRLGPKVEGLWRAGLNSAGAMLPPCISGRNVFVSDGEAMHGKAYLNVYEAMSGRLVDHLATEGMLSQPMASLEDVLIFQDGRKHMVGLDAASLEILWRKELERIYTPPIAGSGSVLLVVRGAAGKQDPGYYSLLSLQPRSGETLWSTPLPVRTIIPPVEFQGRVYLGSEDGQIFCVDARTGDQLWKFALGGEEDFLRTELLLAEGLLLAGTYDGKVVALRVSAASEGIESPDDYKKRGDFESAAAAYALKGNFREAGKIYAGELKDVPKALMLFEHDSLYHEAGELVLSAGMLAEAEHYFQLAGDLERQAEVVLARGDILGAARLYEQASKLDIAARLYEQGGEFGKAKELYRRMGDFVGILNTLNKTNPSTEDIDWLEQNGRFLEAADAAYGLNLLRRAADLYQRAEKPQRELEVLQEFTQREPEHEFAWSRMAALAKKQGRFAEEAEALEHVGKVLITAQAYQRAALQAEQVDPQNSLKIASLYEKAANYFADAGRQVEEQQCRDKLARYRCQPVVVINGQAHKEFKELEMNTLDLEVRNDGYGIARDIRWEVNTERFEIDLKTSEWSLPRLAEGSRRLVHIFIRPKKGEIGTEVPFLLEWFWRCQDGDSFQNKLSVYVSVKGKDDTRPTGQPIIFQGGATVIQTEKYIAGDDLTGGQKGDSVVVGSGRTRISSGQDSIEIGSGESRPVRTCPTCHLPVELDARVCSGCGNPLASVTRRRK